jgi:hypothetical protein
VRLIGKDGPIKDKDGPHLVVHGEGRKMFTSEPDLHTRGPSFSEVQTLLLKNTDDVYFYVDLFETWLRTIRFETPYTSKRVSSTTTIYQEAGYGTCWIAAVLNLIIHVPEARVPFMNALGLKNPKLEDMVFDLFVSNPVGALIMNEYQTLTRRSFSPTGGGDPHDLMKAIKKVVPEVGLTIYVYNKLDKGFIRSLVENNPIPLAAHLFLSKIKAKVEKHEVLRGAIVSGFDERKVGHAIALTYDVPDDKVYVYNWGIKGGVQSLETFLSLYPNKLDVGWYGIPETAKKKLDFGVMPAKKTSLSSKLFLKLFKRFP